MTVAEKTCIMTTDNCSYLKAMVDFCSKVLLSHKDYQSVVTRRVVCIADSKLRKIAHTTDKNPLIFS